MSAKLISVNGEFLDQVSAFDRGLAYGDGLFETVLIRHSLQVFGQDHFNRLVSTAQKLKIPLPKNLSQNITDFIDHLANKNEANGILKIILTRGAGGRGYNPPELPMPTLILMWFDPPQLPSENNFKGILLARCEHPLPSRSALSGMKTLNRLDNVMARMEISGSNYAEGLMCDFDGHVIEGTMMNLFWVKDNTLHTPSLEDVGVHGIMRTQIMQRFETICVCAKEDSILSADELFLCNSVNGIWPVIEFKDRNWQIGPLTKRIQSEFLQFL